MCFLIEVTLRCKPHDVGTSNRGKSSTFIYDTIIKDPSHDAKFKIILFRTIK